MTSFYILAVALLFTVYTVDTGSAVKLPDSTSLDSLDDYSLLSIFDWLRVRDLVNVAALSPRFRQLIVRHYFIGKYHFDQRILTLSDNSIKCYRDDTGDIILLARGIRESIVVMREFCHIFKYFSIEVSDHAYKLNRKFLPNVNKYCSNVCQSLIWSCGREGADIFLPNATDVMINSVGGMRSPKLDEFRIDLAFPRMEKLEIHYQMNLNHHYPHLTEFIFKSPGSIHFEHVRGIMEFNPQLRKIEIPFYYDRTFLVATNQLLPNLESLRLIKYTDRADPNQLYGSFDTIEVVQFKNVIEFAFDKADEKTKFYWTDQLELILGSIQFERLETINVTTGNERSIDFSIRFINKYTELTKVSFLSYRELDIKHLTALITRLTKLEVLTITWNALEIEPLHEYLSNDVIVNSSLKQLYIEVNHHIFLLPNRILRVIPNGWHCNTEQNPIQLYRFI